MSLFCNCRFDSCQISAAFVYLRKLGLRKTSADRISYEMMEALEESQGNKMLEAIPSVSTDDNVFRCDTCNKTLVSLYCIERHVSIHVSDKVYRCSICFKEFLNSDILQKHKKTKHKNVKRRAPIKQIHTCTICSKMLSVNEIKNHYLEHNISQPFRCSICDLGFSFPGNLQRHEKTAHAVGGKKSLYQCEWCKKQFTTAYNLKEHERIHTGDRISHTCGICNKQYNDRSNFNRHMRTHYVSSQNAQLKRENTRLLMCTYCDKAFSTKYRLREHVGYVHTGENRNICNTCGKVFCNQYELKRHSNVHTGDHVIKCDICDMMFSRVSSLNRHRAARHSDDTMKDIECKICNKRFTRHWTLNNHMNLHTGSGQYLCSVCGDSYVWKRQLIQHMADTHCNDPERYSCHYCERSYNTQPRLLSHMSASHPEYRSVARQSRVMKQHKAHKRWYSEKLYKTVKSENKSSASRQTPKEDLIAEQKPSAHKWTNNDKKYMCAICNRMFRRGTDLKTHMKVHSGDSVFCTICNKYFTRTRELKRHMKSASHTKNVMSSCQSKAELDTNDIAEYSQMIKEETIDTFIS